MKVYSIVFVVLVFPVGVSAQNSPPPHQHNVPTNLIDGSKTPDLIPDSTAFRHWLLITSVVPNASNADFVRQQAEVSKLGLTESEKLKLRLVLANFRRQYEALIQRHNDRAKAGKHPDLNLLLQQLDDLVASARTAINTTLSSDSVARIENLVKIHKNLIQIVSSH